MGASADRLGALDTKPKAGSQPLGATSDKQERMTGARAVATESKPRAASTCCARLTDKSQLLGELCDNGKVVILGRNQAFGAIHRCEQGWFRQR